jgi:hypothetical protein
VRIPGVPNVADRVAQTAVAMLLEEKLSRSSTPITMAIAAAECP